MHSSSRCLGSSITTLLCGVGFFISFLVSGPVTHAESLTCHLSLGRRASNGTIQRDRRERKAGVGGVTMARKAARLSMQGAANVFRESLTSRNIIIYSVSWSALVSRRNLLHMLSSRADCTIDNDSELAPKTVCKDKRKKFFGDFIDKRHTTVLLPHKTFVKWAPM